MSAAVRTPSPRIQAVNTRPPRPHKFTVTEFDEMGDRGWFEGRRAFLLDGVILEQGEMNPPHASASGLVQYALQSA